MILNDSNIKKLIVGKELITPYTLESIQPASYDLHLDNNLLVPISQGTVKRDQEEKYEKVSKEGFVLPSGVMVLATTTEWVNIPDDIYAKVEGISSVGRLGLIIHAAGVIDPGFRGNITLELMNVSGRPIDLSDFDRIAQIIFAEMKEPANQPYEGKYQDQQDVTGSRLYMEDSKDKFHELVRSGTLKLNPVCERNGEE